MTDDELEELIETCAELPTHQLDMLIQKLGEFRSKAGPPVPETPNDLVPTTEEPAVQFGIRADGRLILNLRSPAFGWQVFLLSDKSTAAIGLYFRNTAGTAWQEEVLTVHKADGTLM